MFIQNSETIISVVNDNKHRQRNVIEIIKLFKAHLKYYKRREWQHNKRIVHCVKNWDDPLMQALCETWMKEHREFALNKKRFLLSLFLTVAQRMGATKLSINNKILVVFGDSLTTVPLSHVLANTFCDSSIKDMLDGKWRLSEDATYCLIFDVDWLDKNHYAMYDLTDSKSFHRMQMAIPDAKMFSLITSF